MYLAEFLHELCHLWSGHLAFQWKKHSIKENLKPTYKILVKYFNAIDLSSNYLPNRIINNMFLLSQSYQKNVMEPKRNEILKNRDSEENGVPFSEQ